MLINEVWKPLPNVGNNEFLVSSLGRVFNLNTKQFVKPYVHKSRCGVYLRHVFGKKKIMTHVMVATNFPELVPKTDLSCTQVDHDDGNTLNPAAANLKWVSPGYNIEKFQRSRSIIYQGQTIRAVYKKRVKNGKKKKSVRRSHGQTLRAANGT